MFGFGSSKTRFEDETYIVREPRNNARIWEEVAKELCSYGYEMNQTNNVLTFTNQEKKVFGFYVVLSTKLDIPVIKLTGELPAGDGKRLRRFLEKHRGLRFGRS